MFPFDPPENIRKPKNFWCFQGDQKGTLGSKGLNEFNYMVIIAFFVCQIIEFKRLH